MDKTRSTGTVRTSAEARLSSAAVGRISMTSRFRSVNRFPYLPVVTNPENNPCIQTVIRIATNFNHLFIGPLPTFPENSYKSVRKFLRKVANKQTDKQTNNDENSHIRLGGVNE